MAISSFTPLLRKSSCPTSTTPPPPPPLTTRVLLPDYNPQESDLGLKMITTDDNHDQYHTAVVDLSKFSSEVPSTFLGLSVVVQEDPIPPSPAEEQILGAVDLSNFRSEVPSTFLGLRVVQEADPIQEQILTQNCKRKSKKQRANYRQPQVVGPTDLPDEFLRITQPPVFLYRKCLTPTDVDRDQNRLRINDAENVRRFITRDEEHEIFRGPNNFIEVIGVDRKGRGFALRLSIWGRGDRAPKHQLVSTIAKKNKPQSLVFNRQWCDLLETNGVEPNDIAQLWGFRREGRFCLAANFIYHSLTTYL